MASRTERRAARDASSNPPAAMAESPLLSRELQPDEVDEDPRTEPGLIALDERREIEQAARKAALLEAAEYVEGNWSQPHVAQGLREKAARL